MNMKWMITSTIAVMLAGTGFAQQQTTDTTIVINDSGQHKEQRIIIKKNKSISGKDGEDMTVIVDGDKVTINGKPVEEWGDKDIKIFRNGPSRVFPFENGDVLMQHLKPNIQNKITIVTNRAMLGVMTEKDEKGAKVVEVTKESAAEKAGLKKDDIITKVNDTKITDPESLRTAISKFKPEEKVKITYQRNGKEATASATLAKNKIQNFEKNAFTFDDNHFNLPDMPFNEFNYAFNRKPRLGLQIQDMEEGSGVKVTGVDENSPAAKSGLKENDIITEINGGEIKDVDDLRTKIKDLKEGDSYKVKYKRNDKSETVDIKIPKKLKSANL
jgi:serine protease Do